MNYIITKNQERFKKIGNYNYCQLEDMILPDKIAIDTETTGLNCLKDKMFCVQIGTGTNNYLIDLEDYSTSLFKKESISFKEVIPLIKDKILIGQNIGFDLGFFYKEGFYPSHIRDTMIASMILHNGENIRHGFAFIMERELGLSYDKTEQKNIHKIKLSTQKAIEYCFNDVDKLLELEEDLLTKIQEYGAQKTYILNCHYIKAMTYLEMCGLPISEKHWLEKIEQDKLKNKKSELEIIEYIYDNYPDFRNRQLSLFDTSKSLNISLTSPLQMVSVFEKMGINVIDDEGKKSISEDVINKSPHEFVEMWLNYQETKHRLTTFGQNILDKQVNGRIYSRFKPIADTCRMISRKGEINFLNFPADKYTRDCFRAKEGNKIIVCDFDNQEAVTLADKSGNLATLKSINEGADSHCILAREVYPELKEMSDEEIKKNHKDKRQIGKIANFTFAFGGNGYTAAKNLNIPIEEGDRIYEAYRLINKETFEWGEKVLKEALANGYVESADGFKLKLPYFDEFKEAERYYSTVSKEDWTFYKLGKLEVKEAEKNKEPVPNTINTKIYLRIKPKISKYFKQKSKYFRLCLNNPKRMGA